MRKKEREIEREKRKKRVRERERENLNGLSLESRKIVRLKKWDGKWKEEEDKITTIISSSIFLFLLLSIPFL